MKNEDKFFNNSIYDEQAAAFSEKQLTDPMQYQEGMEIIDSDIFDKVQTARAAYDYTKYTEADVRAALAHSERTPDDFAALLSPAALPLLEEIARAAQIERQRYFGNNVTFSHRCISPTTAKITASTAASTVTTKFSAPASAVNRLLPKCRQSPPPASRKFSFLQAKATR